VTADLDLGVAHLRLERRGPAAWCVVDRPEARNALTTEMYLGLAAALHRVAADPSLRALVITGTGDVFVPGGDVADSTGAEPAPPPSRILPYRAILDSAVPVVACVNGICQASGVLLALLADVSVASERATFRVPEVLLGLPDIWMAAVLPVHVGVGRARDLLLSGRRLSAAEACDWGLVTRVVPHGELEAAAGDAVLELVAAAPGARALVRGLMNRRYGVIDEQLLDAAVGGAEAQEGLRSFLEKRPPTWAVAGD